LYLLDFRGIRTGIWDTFGTIEDRDIAQTAGAGSLRRRLQRLFDRCALIQAKNIFALIEQTSFF
jgi:hypothetical protein